MQRNYWNKKKQGGMSRRPERSEDRDTRLLVKLVELGASASVIEKLMPGQRVEKVVSRKSSKPGLSLGTEIWK
jgi:hypothetical protein